MAASIPVLLFGGWTAYRSAEEHRAAALRIARETVSLVAERVTAEMNAQVRVAETLAASTSLDGPDLPAFYREAERVKAMHPLWHTVELDDLAGEQVLNLLRTLGAPLGPTADRDTFDEALRERSPAIGGIGPVGPVSGKRLVALRVPVMRDGASKDVLTVALSPDAVGDILRGAGIPAGWIGAVVDRDGKLIARSADDAATVGLPASPDVQRAIATEAGGSYHGTRRDGVPVEAVFERLAACGAWSVHLGVPRRALDGPVRRALFAVAAAVAASLALGATLVVLLARDLGRRRQRERGLAAAALEASEERTALAVAAADLGTWRWDVAGDAVTCSERCRVLVGLPDDAGPRGTWAPAAFLAAVHPADRGALRAAAKGCVERGGAFAADFRIRGEGKAAPWRHLRGHAGEGEGRDEVYGIIADIDAPKRAEVERSDLLRRLAAAQEDVQRRIAHDLHDQVGQTVTGLSLGLKGLERAIEEPTGSGDAPADLDLGARVRWLRDLAGTIGRDLHRVAADLRPTALDDLGLPKALAALSADWSARYEVAADVQVIGSEERLPDEVATTIYRVVQEALTNVLKHARARTVSVVLDRRPREVRVVIEDDGAGFDPDADPVLTPGGRPRIGLRGMRERLGLIGGTLQIESSPGAGTSLFVAVPLDPDRDAEDAP
ncbi:sensor histidine kinase [Lichenibacterium dinghuense]|uniref:sensor histidine kinase n=1 Tax=Lichenibacterium dinghuense TaxID=2895977 RepID=UPI001F403635|nr:ATP-binding protein [Lichenibacterium sp. 6Y81]